MAGGRLRRRGEEAAVLEQPRDPGGHGGVFRLLGGGGGGKEGGGEEKGEGAIRVASGLYFGAPRRRVGSEFLRLQNSCQPEPVRG